MADNKPTSAPPTNQPRKAARPPTGVRTIEVPKPRQGQQPEETGVAPDLVGQTARGGWLYVGDLDLLVRLEEAG